MENRISATIEQQALANILTAIEDIEKNLPLLINLTSGERQGLAKMGDKTLAFVNKAFEYAKQNSSVVPGFLDMDEFDKDVSLVASLNKVTKPLNQLNEKINDTSMLAGSEAYAAALVFYNAAKSAAKAGVPGMKSVCEDLQVRFPGRSRVVNPPLADQN